MAAPREWFSPAVPVKTGKLGRIYEVTSVRAAAEQMLEWRRRGPKWRKAVQSCMDAMEGKGDASQVRRAFEAAARESGMLIER